MILFDGVARAGQRRLSAPASIEVPQDHSQVLTSAPNERRPPGPLRFEAGITGSRRAALVRCGWYFLAASTATGSGHPENRCCSAIDPCVVQNWDVDERVERMEHGNLQ